MQANDPQETVKAPLLAGFWSSFNKSLRRLVASCLHWAPLWAPLVLLLQITLLGLRPALQERSRLAAERPAVEARHIKSKVDKEREERTNKAWQDPMFKARKERQWYRENENQKSKLKAQLPQEGEGNSTPLPSTDSR